MPYIPAINGLDILIGLAVGVAFLASLAYIGRDDAARRQWKGGRR